MAAVACYHGCHLFPSSLQPLHFLQCAVSHCQSLIVPQPLCCNRVNLHSIFFFPLLLTFQKICSTLKRKLGRVVSYSCRPQSAACACDDARFPIPPHICSEGLLSERRASSFADNIKIIACDYVRCLKPRSPAIMPRLRFTG